MQLPGTSHSLGTHLRRVLGDDFPSLHPGRGGGKGQTQNRAFWGCFGAVFTPPESLGVFYSGWGLSLCHPAEASRLAVPPGNAQHTLLQLPSLVQVTPKQDFPPSPAPKLDFPPPSPAPEQDFPPSPTKSSSTAFPSSKTPQGGGEELVRHHHEGKRAENRQETGPSRTCSPSGHQGAWIWGAGCEE